MTLSNRPLLAKFALLPTLFALALALLNAPIDRADAQQTNANLEDPLSYANLLFSQEQYALAAQQYSRFIRESPDSANLQIAWFRLGECYLKVNQVADAVSSFDFLVKQYKRGPFVGSAAYRLAVIRFNVKDYANAEKYFKISKEQLTNTSSKLQAQFYYARALQLNQKAKLAAAEYAKIIKANPSADNPFYERALLESARLSFELGDTKKALEGFQSLAKSATKREVKEEAIVRGGLLAAEAGDIDTSEELLNQALRFSDTSPWKNLAQVGAIFNAFTREDYDRVIGLYNTGAYSSPSDSRAKMLLIVGHAFRLKGELDSAAQLYSIVQGKYPSSPEGTEAGYRRLQILHQQSDSELPTAAAKFAESQRRVQPNSNYIDMAWLMKAEWHFKQAESSASGPGSDYANKHFNDAARAYQRVRLDNIDEKFRETTLYKTGWAFIEANNLKEGIKALTQFVTRHPKSDYASSAYAKRAVAYQSQGAHQFALGDYQAIARDHLESPESEFAHQQIALIFAHQKKTPEMINAYKDLIKKFPENKGLGEAYYWIGAGYLELEQHQQAIPNLEKGRELDFSLDDKASLRLIICHYQLENIDALAKEAKRYLTGAPVLEADGTAKKRATIPSAVLEYLGKKLAAKDKENYIDAEYFLSHISTPNDPEKTNASTWKLLAECRQKLKMHEGSITAYDHYLLQTERPSDRAEAYLARGHSQYCLRDFSEARHSAQESLRSQKEGRTNAEARILLGDIGAAEGNLEEAAREYLVVSQIFSDPDITPNALAKAINAYRSLGNRERAKELEEELSNQFPNYKVPENFDADC